MKKTLLVTALLAAGLSAMTPATAHDRDHGEFDRGDSRSVRPFTVAVFGDWPYNQNLLDNAALLTKSVNASNVSYVIHVGDIHSGHMPCTSAGIIDPPIASSNPGWNQAVYHAFQQFDAPLIYTPGDNEWTDCHKSKEGSSGDPLNELASVRSLFFAKPGYSLGVHDRKLLSQAEAFDTAYPADSQFVENMMWEKSRVVFATVNLPGSNNDTKPWTGAFSNPSAQDQEVAERTAADIRWLKAAFAKAEHEHARAVVIAVQADMWDPEAVAANELGAYTPFVQQLADLSVKFQRPVLLLNGDSHVYEADRPLADPTSSTGVVYATQPVPNLMRVTVQGSTNAPAEWLRLTVDPRDPKVFSWGNVPYCADPNGSCQ